MRESDILHESGPYWVTVNKRGDYQVFKAGATHSTLCATFGARLPDARKRAFAECDRRASMEGRNG